MKAAPLVLAAPSGAGKTTIARRLVDQDERFVFSISATTRPARPGETDGTDYHFLDNTAFEAMIEAGELAEWAKVHDRYYGTPLAGIEAAAADGRHVVLDIDVQGAEQIRSAMPEAVLVFVLPPSVDQLMKRLTGRGTEAPEEVARRLRSALDELQAAPDFDHLVVNDDLDRCVDEVRSFMLEAGSGKAGAVPLENLEVFRAGIAGILERQFADATK